jgi:hypothetical protein
MNNPLKRLVFSVAAPIRYAIAGIGRKPGSEYMVSMLLSESDLPGANLKDVYNYTYRSFWIFNSSDATRRARDVGSLTAVRILKNEKVGRSLATQVSRFASPEDALSRVEQSTENRLIKPGSTVLSIERVIDIKISTFDGLIVQELLGTSFRRASGERTVAGNVGEIVVRMQFGADGEIEELWSWDEIVSTATIQAERVRRVLAAPES